MSYKLISDAECVQGKCACTTTGCRDICSLKLPNPFSVTIIGAEVGMVPEAELAALRKKCAELQQENLDLLRRCAETVEKRDALQRQLDEIKKHRFPTATVIELRGMEALVKIELGGMFADAIYNGNGGNFGVGTKLYATPSNLLALIEQAKAKECERCVKLIEAQDVDPAFKHRIINSLMRKD